MRIAFIGLGQMGRPMAENLLNAGYVDLKSCQHSLELSRSLIFRENIEPDPRPE
jgi:3-hydroxyisobutyrate dehydrogenase-like beta-hydroxyacid dehydrogenase